MCGIREAYHDIVPYWLILTFGSITPGSGMTVLHQMVARPWSARWTAMRRKVVLCAGGIYSHTRPSYHDCLTISMQPSDFPTASTSSSLISFPDDGVHLPQLQPDPTKSVQPPLWQMHAWLWSIDLCVVWVRQCRQI